MPFKSKAHQAAVMMALKELRAYYKANQGDSRRDHRVMLNPRTGRVYTDTMGTHYDQMAKILNSRRTKSPWLATYLDVRAGFPALSSKGGLYRFVHTGDKSTAGTGKLALRSRGYEVSSVTEKDKAFIRDLNRRFQRIYGRNR